MAMRAKRKGFTLPEVMVSLATISAIAAVSIPIYQSFLARNDLDIAAATIAQISRRAQLLAEASDGDTSWGVMLQTGSVTLFKGASYAARDTAYDSAFDVPGSIAPSGLSEVVYAKFTGLPQTTGTYTITSATNETRNIAINSKGTVSY
jgi:prepilin-type N-terminal cleavage/methylation domain-containing protein